jgi:hypothetical protein
MDTFEQTWRSVLLRVPLAPVPLVQQAVNVAYRRCARGFRWNAQRGTGEFFVPTPYSTGTVTLTQGSTAVVGVGTTWTSAMTGWQLIIAGITPFYTFTYTSATTGTLDRVYGNSDVSGQTYSLQLVYVTPPSDFLQFETVVDPANSFRLYLAWAQTDLDRVDPRRSATGTSWALSAAAFAANSTVPKYELWPRPTGPKSYTFRYQRLVADLSATSDLPIIPIDGDVLREGALAELALWPGTTAERNPYFNPALHDQHEKRFQEGLGVAATRDQEIQLTDLTPADSMTILPLAADFLQNHLLMVP